MPFGLLGTAAGAVIGGIAGAQKQKTRQESGIDLDPASALERSSTRTLEQQLSQLGQLTRAGAGQQDVEAGLSAQRGLADMLAQMSETGGLPTGSDFNTANQFARQVFQGQRQQLQLSQRDARQNAARMAAQLGTTPDDPILQARLAQQQQDAALGLAAQQGSFGAQFAQELPGRRLNFQSQRAQLLQGLSDQAFRNRYNLSSLGQQLQGSERQFRLQTGTRWNTSETGGGLAGALSGAIGGAGSMGSGLTKLFSSFGGGQQQQPGGQVMSPQVGAKNMGGAAAMSGIPVSPAMPPAAGGATTTYSPFVSNTHPADIQGQGAGNMFDVTRRGFGAGGSDMFDLFGGM